MREELTETAFSNLSRFAYLSKGKWLLNLDDSRFMNHSDSPNTGQDPETGVTFALRNIKAGEELTIYYKDFCEQFMDSTCEECDLCK